MENFEKNAHNPTVPIPPKHKVWCFAFLIPIRFTGSRSAEQRIRGINLHKFEEKLQSIMLNKLLRVLDEKRIFFLLTLPSSSPPPSPPSPAPVELPSIVLQGLKYPRALLLQDYCMQFLQNSVYWRQLQHLSYENVRILQLWQCLCLTITCGFVFYSWLRSSEYWGSNMDCRSIPFRRVST